MNVYTPQCSLFRIRLLLAAATLMAAALTVPQAAHAADADSSQTVECMLPGQIHSVGGHATMGPRHPEQTTPDDCRQRGGEYTVEDHPSQPAEVPHVAVANVDDGKIIACLLPRQTRQLGEKARYTTTRHTVHVTRTNCATRGGSMVNPTHTHHSVPKK